MAYKSILSKNYYIVPEAVADFGTQVYNMMAEADQAMAEASEIIADIASLTERVPSHIRCNELLEACASAQAEIKNVDFLSYGQKVEQGLQNLLDHNQYITEHFIKKMGTHTEKMCGMGEEFKRLSELITYSGEDMQSKGIAFSTVSNAEIENTDGTEGNASIPGQDDISKYFRSCDAEKQIAIRLLDTQIYNELGITNLENRQMVIQSILDNKSYVFDNLYILNSKSGADYQRQMSNILSDIEKEYISIIFSTYNIEKQIAIKLLDTQIYSRLGIADLSERQRIIETILQKKSYVLDNLYILNTKSGADYQRQMSYVLFDIEQKYRSLLFLDEQGFLYLCEDEIGPRKSWNKLNYLLLDNDGNIIEMKIQDYNDGGYTIAWGMFFSEKYPERIKLAESLGIDWDNTNEWVTIENIKILFSNISPEVDGYTKYVEKETGVLFTPVQYAVVYDILYFRPFLRHYYVDLINENADRDVWITTLTNAVRKQAGEDNWATFGNGWTARIERSVNSYFDGIYYQKE